jgi:hypothetical protein
MPITRYLDGKPLDPESTSKMSRAFVRAVQTLGVDHSETRREAIAHFIVQMAKWNDRLDEDTLYRNVVAALSGPTGAPKRPSETKHDSPD